MAMTKRMNYLKECNERIEQSEIMVRHYETLGQDDNKVLMEADVRKWEYISQLIEDDIAANRISEIDQDQLDFEFEVERKREKADGDYMP